MKGIMLRIGLAIASLLVAVSITYTPTSTLRKELGNTAWARTIGSPPGYFFNEDASEFGMKPPQGMPRFKVMNGEFRLVSYNETGTVYDMFTEVKMRLEGDILIITLTSIRGESFEEIYYRCEIE